MAVLHAGPNGPGIHRHLHPVRHGHSADTPVLAAQIDDAPPAIALLYVPHRKRRHFGSSQPAAQEDRQDRTVAEALRYAGIRSVQQRLRLPDRKPVPLADTFGGDTLHSCDPIGQLGCQEPVIRGFDRQFPDRRDPHVYGNGAKPAGLQCNAPGGDETLSRTSRFSRCQWAACGTTINSVI